MRANGEIIWVNSLGEVVYDNENKSSRMIGIVRDITKQVTRERRLLQHSLVLNQLNSLVLVLDENTDFTFASSSVVKMTGYSIEEVLGQGWWNLSYISESK